MDGSTPLNRLPVAVIDLETTGLNVATDRIVQLGGVIMKGEGILQKESYNRLVNPQIHIDKKITEIHNIDNEKVQHQPTYRELHLDFHGFIKEKIIVGFNIGFDLAILRNETERLKLKPLNYQYLDVRLLGLVLGLPHELLYLESLSEYFSIPVESRHDAYGDSMLTAKILAKFIPLLRKQKITTLGEAEKCCQEKMSFLSVSYSSDWYYSLPITKTRLPIKEQEWNPIERIDPFPFSHAVYELMTKKLITIDENAKLGNAIKLMSDTRTGSILVHKSQQPSTIIGIFTERDLLNLCGDLYRENTCEPEHIKSIQTTSSLNKQFLEAPVSQVMKSPVKSVGENVFLFQAMQIMVAEKTRHLLVKNSEGLPVGVISQRDFLRTRLENFYQSQVNLEKVTTGSALRDHHAEIPVLARRLLKEELPAYKVAQVISSQCNLLLHKSCEIALAEMKSENLGTPPCAYAVLVLGSAGRGESLLSFDQDNAIVYKSESPENRKWFLTFGKKVNGILHTAGIPLCKGKVMAGEDLWCLAEASWKKRIFDWFTSSKPEAILNADIFVDFIHGFGDENLSENLHQEVSRVGQQQSTFLKLMGEEITGSANPPLTLFGNLKTNKGMLDLKKTALFPIVATARLLALKTGFRNSNQTKARYQYAMKALKLNDYEIEIITELHQLTLEMMLEQQLNHISLGEKPGNIVYMRLFKKRRVEYFQEMLGYLDSLKTVIQDTLAGG